MRFQWVAAIFVVFVSSSTRRWILWVNDFQHPFVATEERWCFSCEIDQHTVMLFWWVDMTYQYGGGVCVLTGLPDIMGHKAALVECPQELIEFRRLAFAVSVQVDAFA